MSEKTLPKGYEPADVEKRWNQHWEETRAFTPDADPDRESYSIVIPPPNVTGTLHMGHALNMTLQDILCRFNRQKGKNVLWVPGMDHAGIATQNVVERQLAAEGLSREDLGREQFVERVWQWKEEYGGKILNQIRRLGASVDWTRERFTYDELLSKAVREVFVQLHDEGLIYKGDYIINWCNRCHTALADDEVEYAAKAGKLYLIRYPYAARGGAGDRLPDLVVATTRPETMLGDTAVAVNPEDERYSDAIGMDVDLPLTGRTIPVIGDSYVDMEFGTGCLKITPAHDPNDFEIGRKHELESLQVIDSRGVMSEAAGPEFAGMTTREARKKVVAELKARGFLVEVKDYDHNVGHCYRCKSVIEPHVSTQWFVKVGPLAAKARDAVSEGETRILPEQWVKVYNNWLDNIRDWCISRQLWWGHRIPAWTCESCGKLIVSREDPTVCPECGSGKLVQDEDVLDTWFSSALWPFSTMGWPEKTKDLETFYPTSVLVTAFDILFFWVARMMMMGIHFMGKPPFADVYIHALVRDAEGKKMSKSVGNVIDPLIMIDKYGCDSLRFTLTAFAAMGRDIKLAEERIEGYRHFVNKIWNAARFVMMNLPESMPVDAASREVEKTPGVHHQWIFHRLEQVKDEVGRSLEDYRFNDAAQALYQFIWHEFCDWYLEMLKPEFNGEDEAAREGAQVAVWTAFTEVLVLLHPIMPFVTAEIWSVLPDTAGDDISRALYPAPRPAAANEAAQKAMVLVQETVVAVRNIRGELNIAPSKELALIVRPAETDAARILEENRGMITTLAKLESLTVDADATPPTAVASAVVQGSECYVPLAGAIDFEDELARLDKELGKIEKELAVGTKKLANEGFVSKAPAEVVAKEKEKVDALSDKRDKLMDLKERLAAASQE
ncbi:valine--tRNA ligase [Oceanidesulfovibrio indonesiensis]|uniref:Valine--tRNA ligase n=1 Tax=Oceanidesulfovibrio indonesiensis TaxID=54767 RepID=A0A7M3MIG2_9BACT|nr:valine--tRNA ligase [Oceanidesulfovibrio indonesiensis]TVM18874.1 valine--tRNA ligase [Oceanidesulfovibrio indonesiensis]